MVGMSLCPSTTIAFLCRANARFHNFSSLCGVPLACGVGLAAARAPAFQAPAAQPSLDIDADANTQATTPTNRPTRRVLFITYPYFFRQRFSDGERRIRN